VNSRKDHSSITDPDIMPDHNWASIIYKGCEAESLMKKDLQIGVAHGMIRGDDCHIGSDGAVLANRDAL